jgi:membrane-associated phospholipid phosphatase
MRVVLAIHNDGIFSNSINSLASIISYIFSPKIWIIIGAIAVFISTYQYLKMKICSKNICILALTLIFATIVATVLKVVVARYRPEMLIFNNQYGFHFFSIKKAYNSMPSGHTTLSFAGLLAIANFFNRKYITVLAITIACFIAVSRIIILDHYISDVIVAIYIGIFSYMWAKSFVESKFHSET